MRSAVIVSTARTPIGRAYRGAFNDTNAQTLGGHAVRAAVERARLDPAEVEDVIMGAALQQGCQGSNVGRQVALAAGLPDTVPGDELVDVVEVAPGLGMIVVGPSRYLRKIALVRLVEVAPSRFLLTIPSGTSISQTWWG